MAILKFRAYFQEDESIYRDIAIKHTSSFFELHSAILIAYEFDNKHAATFYRSNDSWQRGREISVVKYDKPYKAEPLIMNETVIGTEVKDTNQRFIYEYDFDRSWLFAIELISVEKVESDKLYYPLCVRTEGVAPPQYGSKGLVDKRLAEMEEKYDLKPTALEDGYGTEGEEGDDAEVEEDDSDVQGDEYGEEI
jgi:Plasmid pRiA4b ORF-3-like protein